MALHQRFPYVIPAAASIANVLAGAGIEYIGRASMLDLFAAADATGDTFSLSVTIGGDQKIMVPAGTSINVASVSGAGPKMSEDAYVTGAPVAMGSHLILALLGTAAHTGRFAITLNP
jgi:hypothetical protein